MKTIDMRRHAEKEMGGRVTTVTGRQMAKTLGSLSPYDYLVAGLLPHSWETLAAFMLQMPNVCEAWVLASVAEFGDDGLFASWGIKGLSEATAACGGSYFEGLRKILTTEEFKDAQMKALTGIQKVFSQMAGGTKAVAFGHTPVIELAASAVNPDFVDPKLLPLDGFSFYQSNNGEISVKQIGDQ